MSLLTTNGELRPLGIRCWTLPAFVVTLDDGSRFNVCPSAGPCARVCYARFNAYSEAMTTTNRTARQEVLSLAAAAGADLEVEDGPGLHASVWAPAGVNWKATGGHSVSVHYFTDRPAGWADLAADLRLGTEPCTDPECDTCNGW